MKFLQIGYLVTVCACICEVWFIAWSINSGKYAFFFHNILIVQRICRISSPRESEKEIIIQLRSTAKDRIRLDYNYIYLHTSY